MAERSLEDLQSRHAELDKMIHIEESRRVPDEDALTAMKKEKLVLKDHLEGIVG